MKFTPSAGVALIGDNVSTSCQFYSVAARFPYLVEGRPRGWRWRRLSCATGLEDNWRWCRQTICIIRARICAPASKHLFCEWLLWSCNVLCRELVSLVFSVQVMHGEGHICLGFLVGRRARVVYLSDLSRFLPSTEHGMIFVSSIILYSSN
jgi:hypothetical protein